MLRASIDEVLDAQAAPELVAEILTAVQAVPGVACVKAALRDSRTFMCAFPAIVTVREGHDIAHLVKNSSLQGNFRLADVVVHIEPEADEGSTPEPT